MFCNSTELAGPLEVPKLFTYLENLSSTYAIDYSIINSSSSAMIRPGTEVPSVLLLSDVCVYWW